MVDIVAQYLTVQGGIYDISLSLLTTSPGARTILPSAPALQCQLFIGREVSGLALSHNILRYSSITAVVIALQVYITTSHYYPYPLYSQGHSLAPLLLETSHSMVDTS